MTIQDAASMIRVAEGKRRIMEDPSLTLFGKVRSIAAIDNVAKATPAPRPLITPGQAFQGFLGAEVGRQAAGMAARWLGLSDSTVERFQNYGLGLGSLWNAGAIRSDPMSKTGAEAVMEKIAEVDKRDRSNAVMLGFLKGARDSGLIDNETYCREGMKVGYVAVTPDVFTAPVRAAAGTSSSIAGSMGSLGAQIVGEDETDEEIQKMKLEQRMLDVQAERLRAQRRNRLLARVLRRRQPA